ncbi:hypothetical protein GDO81_029281, partial [Engystomops pustulosus]
MSAMISSSLRRCLLPSRRVSPLLQTCRTRRTQARALHGAAAAGVTEGDKKMKTFDDLPGPSGLTELYWFFIRGYLLHTHELQVIYKKRYGPWWKSVLGDNKAVIVTDPAILEVLLRQEGKNPLRNDIDLWRTHREMRNFSYGPFTERGEKWRALRTVLNQKMLKPKEAKNYAGSINEVISDFMTRLQELRRQSPSGDTVTDMANELYRFALEGV